MSNASIERDLDRASTKLEAVSNATEELRSALESLKGADLAGLRATIRTAASAAAKEERRLEREVDALEEQLDKAMEAGLA